MEFENLEYEKLESKNSEFENPEFKNSEFENSKLNIENVFELYASSLTTFWLCSSILLI